MIQIKRDIFNGLIEHARRDTPVEACGYLAGKNRIITKQYKLTNMDQSPEHFSLDPAEQFEVLKKVRDTGLEIMANYHSHPATPARPSQEDIRLAYDADIYYCIVSLAGNPEIKFFKIQNQIVTEQQIQIID